MGFKAEGARLQVFLPIFLLYGSFQKLRLLEIGLVWCEVDESLKSSKMTTYQYKTVRGNRDVKPDQQEVVSDRHCFHCIHPVYTYLIQLNVFHISLSLFSFLSILFQWAQNALKKDFLRRVVANCNFTKVTIDSDSFQHKNAITFWKRRQQEKHSWCVINAWRKTRF